MAGGPRRPRAEKIKRSVSKSGKSRKAWHRIKNLAKAHAASARGRARATTPPPAEGTPTQTVTLVLPTNLEGNDANVSPTFEPTGNLALLTNATDGDASTATLAAPASTSNEDTIESPKAGSSKGSRSKQRPGYRPPQVVRRPQRQAKLQASKAIVFFICLILFDKQSFAIYILFIIY